VGSEKWRRAVVIEEIGYLLVTRNEKCVRHNLQSCTGTRLWQTTGSFHSTASKHRMLLRRNLTRFASFLQNLATQRQTVASSAHQSIASAPQKITIFNQTITILSHLLIDFLNTISCMSILQDQVSEKLQNMASGP
jgi:hypothetical protein